MTLPLSGNKNYAYVPVSHEFNTKTALMVDCSQLIMRWWGVMASARPATSNRSRMACFDHTYMQTHTGILGAYHNIRLTQK